MLRNLIFLGMLVGAASMAGWLTIDRQDDQTTIQFNRDEFRNDARAAIDRGRQYLDQRDAAMAADYERSAPQGWDPGFAPQGYEAHNYQAPTYSPGYAAPAPQAQPGPYRAPGQPPMNYYPASHSYPSDPRNQQVPGNPPHRW